MAIERDRKRRDGEQADEQLRNLFATLTAREHKVMTLVISGPMNKQAAAEMGLSEITVKIHRSRVMKEFGLGLGRLGANGGNPGAAPQRKACTEISV